MNKTTIIVLTCLIALATMTLSLAETNLVERSFSVDQGGTFFIDTDSGSIEIESHNRNTVEVEVDRKGGSVDDLKLTFSQDGNDVTVIGERKKTRFWGAMWISRLLEARFELRKWREPSMRILPAAVFESLCLNNLRATVV